MRKYWKRHLMGTKRIKSNISILLMLLVFGLMACNSKVENKNDKVKATEEIEAVTTEIDSPDTFDDIWQRLPLKLTPLIDTTNFDNTKKAQEFSAEEIELLQLSEIYPNIGKEGYDFKFLPSYKLELSDDFFTIVLTVFKGDHELEAVLINYSLKEKLTAHKVIAYDEIAEGWSRKHAKIENSVITIIDEFYGDSKQVDITKLHIDRDGKINQMKPQFSSDLRPGKPISLDATYTDTIQFSSYDDDYDYWMLTGKKNGHDIALIYNWDWRNNDKYNFKEGEFIRVTWKMDSISQAGDEEIVDLKERAIDAERVSSDHKHVRFLWREEKFDEESNQNFNSIVINESFSNSISNQEKAALGYVATFIGNECSWDGKANEDRSNLKCEILTALGLGYQCSDKHLGFLQSWFSQDTVVLKKLENCGTMPNTATVQTTFDEISIVTDKNDKTISVNCKANGVNIRESRKWSWTQTDNFEYDLENITLINSQKSELTNENIEVSEK